MSCVLNLVSISLRYVRVKTMAASFVLLPKGLTQNLLPRIHSVHCKTLVEWMNELNKFTRMLMETENIRTRRIFLNICSLVHWFIWCSSLWTFIILCHFRKFSLCQISGKVICSSESLHRIENLRLSLVNTDVRCPRLAISRSLTCSFFPVPMN